MGRSTKAWEEANREKRRAQKAAVYAANREEAIAKSTAYNTANREAVRVAKKAYYLRRREELIAYQLEWARGNRDKKKVTDQASRQRHPESGRVRVRNRAARLRAAEGHHTAEEVLTLLKRQKHRCANPICRVSIGDGYHVDHFRPLALGGSNWITNIQLLCGPCNHKKGAKDPDVWARERSA